jgi:hypothetical protein
VTFDPEKIYALLPAFFRIRDLELDTGSGPPLKSYLSVIAEQIAVLEDSIEQLYDDEFIETCSEWVVPYIGDLVGARGLFQFPGATFSQRALVANTIRDRRRKGTASILEQLARDVTEWDASVVEYFQLLIVSQYMKHIRLKNIANVDLRNEEMLENIGTPFDTAAHTAEMRRIEPARGRFNIPNIGIYLWRIGSFSITNAPAFRLDDRRYRFDVLGKDIPLFNAVQTEETITHLAGPLEVPMPMRRRAVARNLGAFYGPGLSMLIIRDGQEVTLDLQSSPPVDPISICDLSDLPTSPASWAHMPLNTIVIDPELGRIAFPSAAPPPSSVRVTYHYGFSAQMGGGDYSRSTSFVSGLSPVVPVIGSPPSIQAALDTVAPTGGVVELESSDLFQETPFIHVAAEQQVEFRAKDETRPVLLAGGDILISGGDSAEVTINGLLIAGARLRIPVLNPRDGTPNGLQRVTLLHCTLVPAPETIIVELPNVVLDIQLSIIGSIRAIDSATVQVQDSIIDTTSDSELAYAGLNPGDGGGTLQLINTTVFGRIHAIEMNLISSSLLVAVPDPLNPGIPSVVSDRTQDGCVRFSRIPADGRTPRQYKCTADEPVFTSTRYGDPAYCRLDQRCSASISAGGDDGAEMGAFHNLFQPQRVANLRARLDEYLRFGLEAGIFFAS